nr:MAG: hypothetical protein [Microviridae sp.]
MEKATNKNVEVQGTNAVINGEEKKVQMSIKMLKELAGNPDLLRIYLEIILGEEEIKTPIAYTMAKRELKQLKIAI